MGFKPMTKYFTAFEISKPKAYKKLKERLWNINGESLQHSGFHGIDTLNCNTKFLSSNIKRESFTNSAFDGIQTHDNTITSFRNIKEESQ